MELLVLPEQWVSAVQPEQRVLQALTVLPAQQVLAPQALQAPPDQLVQELQALLGPQELALQVLPE